MMRFAMGKMKKERGFTLVELIVVLVILAILAAILVPALLGYIDRAKSQDSVQKVHDIQVATTSALAEYYAFHKDEYAGKWTPKSRKMYGKGVSCYSITNFTFKQLQETGAAENTAKIDAPTIIAKLILKYLDSEKKDGATYNFAGELPTSKKSKDMAATGIEGLSIYISPEFKVLYIQYSDLKGNYITYDNKGKIEVKSEGTFES